MKSRGFAFWFFIVVIIVGFFLIPSSASRVANNFILKSTGRLAKSFVHVGRRISESFSVVFEIGNLQQENQRLADEIVRSKVDSSKYAEMLVENQNLKEQLKYKDAHPELQLVIANVIGLDPTNYYDTILLDRGSNDGVAIGMAVTSLGVLVGKINQVTDNTSRVLLVTSKDSIVQIMFEKSRTTGVLKGGISGMTLENIPLDTAITDGENVITSGLGGRLPKGIFVGNASKEISVKSDIFKTIEIKSPLNFQKFETLFIVAGV
jgi:rod shape-determining protein MreC